MKVKFIKKIKDQAANMMVGHIYEVIGIEGGDYRIICDKNEPYLYEAQQFEVIDSTNPDFWVIETDEDGDLYAYPFAWFHSFFFEDYFDGVTDVVESFWKECERLYKIKRQI